MYRNEKEERSVFVVFYLKLGVFMFGFFCTEVFVYIDTSPYFCQTDDVIGAQAWGRAGPGRTASCSPKFREKHNKTGKSDQ